MQYKTHLATTVVLGLPMMASVQQVSPLNLFALGLGALLPDIDHPQSFLGKRNKIVSKVTNKALGHRGATHSLLALVVVFVIMAWLQDKYLTNAAQYVGFWLILGYLAHLLEDTFSKETVRWLWPLKKQKRNKRKDKLLYYRTGGIEEILVLGLILCLLLLEIHALVSGTLVNLFPQTWMIHLQDAFLALQRCI